MGRCRLEKRDVLYLVMEYAEEDLSQVVGTRALTPGECRQMLPPVLDALGYIHRKGFVHGHIKPSNIMAVGEQVKISCDGLVLAGEPSTQLGTPSVYDPPETATEGLSPAGDVWSLGMLVVEVLTRKVPVLEAGRKEPLLPAAAPRPLLDVVRHALRLDRSRRWTVSEIAARLAPANPMPSVHIGAAPQEASWRPRHIWAVLALALVAVAVFAGLRYRHSSPVQQHPASAEAPPPVVAATPVPAAAAPVAPVAVAPAPVAKTVSPAPVAVTPAVLHKVLPRVPQSARDTITGTVRVRVRVRVDHNGNVARAAFDAFGPSKYFARLSMQAARQWKFTPASPHVPREWLLRFEYRQNSTHAFAIPL
jgi:TonB family protein